MEIWKDIINFEESYQVSNLGNIKSKDRYVNSKNNTLRFSKGIILKLKIDKDGYFKISLYKNQIPTHFIVHRLVAIMFIPNPENKPQVNHKNGIKNDNRVENLEWCTNKENINHSWDSLNRNNNHRKGELCNFSKLKEKDVIFIRENYNKKKLNQKKLSKMFNISDSLVSQIINNKIWQKVKTTTKKH